MKNHTHVCVPCRKAARGSGTCPCGGGMVSFPSMRCELPKRQDRWWTRPATLVWFRAAQAQGWAHELFPWPRDRRKEKRARKKQMAEIRRRLSRQARRLFPMRPDSPAENLRAHMLRVEWVKKASE